MNLEKVHSCKVFEMKYWPALVLVSLFFFCCCDLLLATPVVEDKRPNILWLTIEDVGPELGCYGDPHAKTPALDAFAKSSLRYKTAWSNYPVCAPARTTIISGRYASSMAAGNMRSEVPMPSNTVMFPTLLRKAGYYCTNHTTQKLMKAKFAIVLMTRLRIQPR